MDSESQHKGIVNLTPLDKSRFFWKRFRSPRMLSKSVPLRSTHLSRHKMNRSLNFDVISPRKDNLSKHPHSYLDNNSFETTKSLRDLSRSAKIMRALHFKPDSFCPRNMNIKKSLNFDSSPSPQKINTFDINSPTDSITDTSSPILDKPLRLDSSSNDSATSSILASLESIDENQNQTPQQNRKIAKMSSKNRRINTEKNANESGSSSSTSSLRSNLKEKIDNILQTSQTPDLHSLKKNRSEAFGNVIVASTPRNLFQEFNQDTHNRSYTPDNMIDLIPESMSAIKKSHKKEKLHGYEERLFTLQKNIPARNEDTHTSMLESRVDTSAIAGCSTSFVKEPQRKNRKIKKTLIYDSDNDLSHTGLVSGCSSQEKVTSRENDFFINALDERGNNKIQNIDSSDCERCEENIQQRDNTHFTSSDDKEVDHSVKNNCIKNIFQLSQQEKSSNICNVNVMDGNRAVSPERTVSQASNGAVTPENNINILEHIFTESIKKSHKKIKHENRKTKIKAKKTLEVSAQDTFNDEQCKDVENEAALAICMLSSHNADRPSTPENVNSSRLLLPEFKSVKKSHKKDKYSKRISGLAKCHKYHEYRKRYDNSLQDDRDDERNTSKTLHGNESLELNESFDVSPKKKKKSMSVSFESDVRKLHSSKSSALRSLEINNTNDEFKIHTPTRKVSRFAVTNDIYADGMSQEKDEPIQTSSKEINCSRCVTPVSRSKKQRENEDLSYFIKILETDASVSRDGPVNIADPRGETGRSTPINMSTTEVLCNIDSIKKSHKKDKHSRNICKRRVLSKNKSNIEETGNVNFTSMLKQYTSLKHIDVDNEFSKTGMCSNTSDEGEKSKCYEEIIYDDSLPSTSQARDSIDVRTVKKSILNTTPPNNSNVTNFVKRFHTISIKKSHKKERDCKAQAKYILMNEEHELSDDGSIFDEEDRLNFSDK